MAADPVRVAAFLAAAGTPHSAVRTNSERAWVFISDHDSPYGASRSELCDLVVCAALGIRQLRGCVERLRGVEIALPYPRGYVYFVGTEDDTVLTRADLRHWKSHPLMFGGLCVIGTIGCRRAFAWDRHVIATNTVGHVYLYEMHTSSFILRIAESLTELLSEGISRRYMQVQRDLRSGITPTVIDLYRGTALGSLSPSEPYRSQWVPLDVGGVICAKVPSERICRGVRLRINDFPDVMFKTVSSSVCL